MGGCVATAGRHSLLSLHWLLITGCLLHISSISPLRNYKQHGSAKRDLPSETHCKLRSSAAVGTDDNTPSLTVPRSGTDTVTMILRTVHRSRFAEPRESVSVFAYPQRRSFGACSGFQIDTCPIGTRRSSYCHTVTEYCRFNHLSCHANIVQRVKTCYKIKINSRESKRCFYGVMLCKQHQCLTIAPLLQSNSATIRV